MSKIDYDKYESESEKFWEIEELFICGECDKKIFCEHYSSEACMAMPILLVLTLTGRLTAEDVREAIEIRKDELERLEEKREDFLKKAGSFKNQI